jgi:peptidoglycan/xylan/chitin deacetylase (PgdA/CDA1 family)
MGKNVSVCLSFDFDAISVWIGTMRAKSLSVTSRGEFGKVGAERLLDTLTRYDIPSTWFVPGHTIDTFPTTVQQIVDAGHEIGHHGYCHENIGVLSLDEGRHVMERGSACVRRLTGKDPVGFRCPGGSLTPPLLALLLEFGFLYDSSLLGDDFTPYYCRVGDEIHTDGPYVFGQPVDLVELPFDWSLDDWPYFNINWRDHHVGLRTPDEVYKIWAADFDFLYQRMGAGVYTLTMHPQVIGRGHRILMLERLIEYMKGHEGVTFKTMGQVASEWRRGNSLAKP